MRSRGQRPSSHDTSPYQQGGGREGARPQAVVDADAAALRHWQLLLEQLHLRLHAHADHHQRGRQLRARAGPGRGRIKVRWGRACRRWAASNGERGASQRHAGAGTGDAAHGVRRLASRALLSTVPGASCDLQTLSSAHIAGASLHALMRSTLRMPEARLGPALQLHRADAPVAGIHKAHRAVVLDDLDAVLRARGTARITPGTA